MSEYVIIVNNTIMDGEVARWYGSNAAAINHQELISASRNGVVGGEFAYLTPDLFSAAWAAHERLKAGESVKDIATHEFGMFDSLPKPIGVPA